MIKEIICLECGEKIGEWEKSQFSDEDVCTTKEMFNCSQLHNSCVLLDKEGEEDAS